MKKKLTLFIFLFLFSFRASALEVVANNSVLDNMIVKNGVNVPSSKLSQLMNYPGLSFYDDNLDATANFSIGGSAMTYSRTGSASNPATYTQNCVVTVDTANNHLRSDNSYYDTEGCHYYATGSPSYYHTEIQSTNLVPQANTVNDATWAATNITASNADNGSSSPDGTTTAPSLTATADNGTFLLTSNVTAQTYSVFIKRKTGTGLIYITANGGASWTAVTLASDWAKFIISAASASQKCGIKLGTNGDAIYVWGNQFENIPYSTSRIITSGSSLTRNGDNLSGTNGGNNQMVDGTYYFRVIPDYDLSNDSKFRTVLDTDTKHRLIRKLTTATTLRGYPNNTDSAVATAQCTTSLVENTSYVYAMVVKHTNSYTRVYMNGSSEGSNATDYTNPFWGTSFYIGNDSSGNNQFGGHIVEEAFYRVPQDDTTVAAISSILAGN